MVLVGTARPVWATLPGPTTPVDYPDFGKTSRDKKGAKKSNNREENRQKQCREHDKASLAFFYGYCFQTYVSDPSLYELCVFAFSDCCNHYLKCRNKKGDACIAATGH